MADTDFAAGVPVRSEADGTDQRVHVKVVDGTVSPAVNQMKVDSDNAAKVLDTGHNPSGANVALRVSELGAITPDGVYSLSNNTKPGNVGMIASSRSATPGDTTQTNRISSITGSNNQLCMDVSIHDDSGNLFSLSNPLPVFMADSPSGATKIFAEVDGLAIAAGSSSNLDYAVTSGKTLHLRKVLCSASGKFRFELQTSSDGVTFTRLFVVYSAADNNNPVIDFGSMFKDVTGTGSKVRVVALNQDKGAQDAHVLFIGDED